MADCGDFARKNRRRERFRERAHEATPTDTRFRKRSYDAETTPAWALRDRNRPPRVGKTLEP
jgi:hypothetical protein